MKSLSNPWASYLEFVGAYYRLKRGPRHFLSLTKSHNIENTERTIVHSIKFSVTSPRY